LAAPSPPLRSTPPSASSFPSRPSSSSDSQLLQSSAPSSPLTSPLCLDTHAPCGLSSVHSRHVSVTLSPMASHFYPPTSILVNLL
jgi:hypothetical protein